MPVPVGIVRGNIRIANVLVPASGNAELRAKVIAGNGGETYAANALLVQKQGGIVRWGGVDPGGSAEEAQIGVRSVQQVEVRVKLRAIWCG